MKKLYLARHGQTVFNKAGKSQGWLDSSLTDEGIAQAMALRNYLVEEGLHFDSAYTSPLGRAKKTMEIIAKDYIENIHVLDGLKELSFGSIEGRSVELVPNLPFENKLEVFGGESETTGLKRFMAELVPVMDEPENQCIFAISHGSIIRTFSNYWGHLSDLPIPSLTSNCSLQVYHYQDGKFYLKEYIETCK